MAQIRSFSEEELAVDVGLGYPRAYANLCRNLLLHGPFTRGPPFAFYPYALQPQDDLSAKEFDQIFPLIDSKTEGTTNPGLYINLLWKQLSHLGNAGFDPAKFRVDQYGNVLFFNADSSSPLAWDIDHWFPCSRGGRTIPSNLRILQWQVVGKKRDKLEFLVPWWDLQLGISVNQFISIFASSNSDFRNRAFSWLFLGGKNEELNELQDVESHSFPQHFVEAQYKIGPAPAAIVYSRREMCSKALKPIDFNRYPRSNSPTTDVRKFSVEEDEALSLAVQQFNGLSPSMSNNNENCYTGSNQYLAIAAATDSLRQRQLEVKKLSEIRNLDDELNELKAKNEVERLGLQELELTLIKRRRRAEKCRRLAEAQSTYKASLEKMIRDAMHQSVVYKEQIRLTQTANSTLNARLEAQKAICESAKKELQRRLQQKEEIENQIDPNYHQHGRKRSRINDNHMQNSDESPNLLPNATMQKELRSFLEEDHSRLEAGGGSLMILKEKEQEGTKEVGGSLMILKEKEQEGTKEVGGSLMILKEKEQEGTKEVAVNYDGRDGIEDITRRKAQKEPGEKVKNNTEEIRHRLEEIRLDQELEKLVIEDGKHKKPNDKPKSFLQNLVMEDGLEHDEEYRKKIGKGNVEKWLQMLLENAQEEPTSDTPSPSPNQCVMNKSNQKPKHKINIVSPKLLEEKMENGQLQDSVVEEKKQRMNKKDGAQEVATRRNSFETEPKEPKNGKQKGLARSESARAFRQIPSSPSVILEIRRRVDCIGRKPLVMEDADNNVVNQSMMSNQPSKTSINTYTKGH